MSTAQEDGSSVFNNPLGVVRIVDLRPVDLIVSATFFSVSPFATFSSSSASSSAPSAVVVPAPVSGSSGAPDPSVAPVFSGSSTASSSAGVSGVNLAGDLLL